MYKKIFVLLIFIILFFGCINKKSELGEEIASSDDSEKDYVFESEEAETPSSGEFVVESSPSFTFQTQDGFVLTGDLFVVDKKAPTVILLHMLSKNRYDWTPLIKELNKAGFNAFAYDLRGHGESNKQDNLLKEWKLFSPQDYQNMVFDISAAKNVLLKREMNVSDISLAGASIGANIALLYASKDKNIDNVVMLSGSLGYRGEETGQAILDYKKPILIVSSKEDNPSSPDSELLFSRASEPKKLQMYDGGVHGTNLFATQPELIPMIVEWLKNPNN